MQLQLHQVYIESLPLQGGLLIQATCPFLPQAHGVPTPVLLAALLLAAGSAAVNALMLHSSSKGSAPRGTAAWRLWRGVLCATGFAMLPQVRHLPAVWLSGRVPVGPALGGAVAGMAHTHTTRLDGGSPVTLP